jgi:hypothetical protein
MTNGLALVSKECTFTDGEYQRLFQDAACPGALCVARAEDPLPALLSAGLAVDQIRTIKGFNPASAKMTKSLMGLTWALLFVGVVQLAATGIYSGLEKWKGSFPAAASPLGLSCVLSLCGGRLL